jgi:hypothetical protein
MLSKNDPLHVKTRQAEIEQQANSMARSAKILDALRSVIAIQGDGGLQLDKHCILHDQVSHIDADDLFAIPNVDCLLLLDFQVSSPQFDGQRVFVNLLKEAASECIADGLRCPDDPSGYPVRPGKASVSICVHLWFPSRSFG